MKIVYLSRKDGTDMRVTKICNSLSHLGHDVVFVGWDRTPDKSKDIELVPNVKRRILQHRGKLAQNSFQGWGTYCRHLIATLGAERPDVVHTVNEELAVIALPFKGIFFKWLVVDVFDSVIANKYRTRALDWLAILCRAVANAAADRIIETGAELQAKLGRHATKSVVIENAPKDPGEDLALRFPAQGAIRLALGGTISRRRVALDQLIAALDASPVGSVEVEASGWLHDDYSKERFIQHPAVRYRWLKSPSEFLRMAATCDAILYIRGDSDDSPYRAAVLPNRIFDCLAVGRPIIVNAQLSLAKWVESERLGYVVSDLKPDSLLEVIGRLRTDRAQIKETAERLRRVFRDGHTWDVMEKRLGGMYAGLEAGSRRGRWLQD